MDTFIGVKWVSRWTIQSCSKEVHACRLLGLCLIISEVRCFKVLNSGFLIGETLLLL